MAITTEKKKELVSQFQVHKKDTGSPEVQVSILTEKINQLTDHLGTNPKDYQSQRGLLTMVSKRRSTLKYLQRENPGSYKRVIEQLGIRG